MSEVVQKYLIGLAVVRQQQRQMAAAHWELQQKLAALEKRLVVLESGNFEPLFSPSFGQPSEPAALTSPRWLH